MIETRKSTDVSAPVIDGLAGSLITFLDAVLVNGYGAQASLGWTKEFSGVNKAVYRMPAGTNQFYLQVHDDEVTNTRYAKIRGFESMTDVDTGTNAFPTVAQDSNYYWHKSNANGASVSEWALYSDGGRFHLAIAPPAGTSNFFWSFGDASSIIPLDNWFTYILGTDTASIGTASADGWSWQEMAVARDYTGVVNSLRVNYDCFLNTLSSGSTTHTDYPLNASEKLNIMPRSTSTGITATNNITNNDLRGFYGGIFNIINDYNAVPNNRGGWDDFFTDQNGVTYDLVCGHPTLGQRWWAIQTSGSWL